MNLLSQCMYRVLGGCLLHLSVEVELKMLDAFC